MIYKIETIIAPEEIPSARRGRESRDWKKILAQIPVGKVWKLSEDNKDLKISSVREGVKAVNKKAKKQLYKVQQRTIDEKKFLFVTRLV